MDCSRLEGGGITQYFFTPMNEHIIHRQLVSNAARIDLTNRLFGIYFPIKLEPTVFLMATTLSEDYQGGYWEFFALTNGGFYMAPNADHTFAVVSMNGHGGVMSPEAFGVTACLFAYSQLSFGGNTFADTCGEHFHLLRDYAKGMPEADLIMAVID
jgi:hypothetical protein